MKSLGYRKVVLGFYLFVSMLAGRFATGQDLVTEYTPPVATPAAAPLGVVSPPAPDYRPDTETSPIQLGPVAARPHVMYRYLYADGLQAAPGQRSTSDIHDIAPGIWLGWENIWALDYTPVWRTYSNDRFRDTVNHSINLRGQSRWREWDWSLSQDCSLTDSPLVETGGQTRQESYITGVTASSRFSDHFILDLAVNQILRFPQGLVESREWSTLDWLSYQFTPTIRAGVGLGVGYVNVTSGADAIYGQGLGRVQWIPSPKLTLELRGGVEDRHFLGTGSEELINPIFGALIRYRPVETTEVSLSASRTVNPSYSANQVTETSEVSGSINQRFLRHLYLNAAVSYHAIDYVGTRQGTADGRSDEYYSIGIRVSTTLLKRLQVAGLYQRSENITNRAGFGYASDQIGAEATFRY